MLIMANNSKLYTLITGDSVEFKLTEKQIEKIPNFKDNQIYPIQSSDFKPFYSHLTIGTKPIFNHKYFSMIKNIFGYDLLLNYLLYDINKLIDHAEHEKIFNIKAPVLYKCYGQKPHRITYIMFVSIYYKLIKNADEIIDFLLKNISDSDKNILLYEFRFYNQKYTDKFKLIKKFLKHDICTRFDRPVSNVDDRFYDEVNRFNRLDNIIYNFDKYSQGKVSLSDLSENDLIEEINIIKYLCNPDLNVIVTPGGLSDINKYITSKKLFDHILSDITKKIIYDHKVIFKYAEIIKTLIENGANFKHIIYSECKYPKDIIIGNILHFMFYNKIFNIDIVKFLIDNGIDINDMSIVSETPFMTACKHLRKNKYKDKFLLELIHLGANGFIKDKHGKTPFQVLYGNYFINDLVKYKKNSLRMFLRFENDKSELDDKKNPLLVTKKLDVGI